MSLSLMGSCWGVQECITTNINRKGVHLMIPTKMTKHGKYEKLQTVTSPYLVVIHQQYCGKINDPL